MKIPFKISMLFEDRGLARAEKRSERYAKNFERAEEAQRRAQRTLEKGGFYTESGGGGGGGGGGGASPLNTYKTQRSTIGTRGADARNFSGLAGAAGAGQGIVAAYATLASTLFAVTAGFQALSQAARVEQLTAGLEILGARGGTSLKATAQGLREVTDNAISTAEAMKAVASASAAGLGQDEINRLGRVARGASLALGRNLGESMDRLTRGAIKLEPELLDELGIMVRLDEAVKQYALENNKVASSLSLTERRQAFLNAVLEEGERKFGEIADNAGTNPYDRLQAAVQDFGTSLLTLVNGPLKFFVNIGAAIPALILLPLMNTIKTASSKIFPTFSSQMENMTGKIESQQLAVNSLRGALEDQQGTMEYGISLRKKFIEDMDIIEALDQAGIDADKIDPAKATTQTQRDQMRKALLDEIAFREKDIVNVSADKVAAEEAVIRKLRSALDTYHDTEDMLGAINSRLITRVAIESRSAILLETNKRTIQDYYATVEGGGSVFKALGTAVYRFFGNASTQTAILKQELVETNGAALTLAQRFKVLAFRVDGYLSAAWNSTKLVLNGFLRLIPIIGNVTIVFGLITGALNFIKSEAQKTFEATRKELGELAKSSEKVGIEIQKAFDARNYTQGFEAAIKNMSEIVDKLGDLEAASQRATSYFASPAFVGGTWAAKTINNLKRIGAEVLGIGTVPTGQALAGVSNQEAAAYSQLVARAYAVSAEKGRDLEIALSNASLRGEDLSQVAKDNLEELTALEGAWNSIGEAAKKAGEGVKKFYGPSFLQTTYSDVANNLSEIDKQFKNIREAGLDDGSIFSAVNELLKGGMELAGELDNLAGGDTFFRETFDQISTLEARINQLRRDGVDKNRTAIDNLVRQADAARLNLARAYQEGNFELQSAIKNTAQFIKEKTLETLKADQEVLKVQKQIADVAEKRIKVETQRENLRRFGTLKSPSRGAALQAERDAAVRKAEIENAESQLRLEIIDAEYDLARYKLQTQLDIMNLSEVNQAVIPQAQLNAANVGNITTAFDMDIMNQLQDLRTRRQDLILRGIQTPELDQQIKDLQQIYDEGGIIGATLLQQLKDSDVVLNTFEEFKEYTGLISSEVQVTANNLYTQYQASRLIVGAMDAQEQKTEALKRLTQDQLDLRLEEAGLAQDKIDALVSDYENTKRAVALETERIKNAKALIENAKREYDIRNSILEIVNKTNEVSTQRGVSARGLFTRQTANAQVEYLNTIANINIKRAELQNSLRTEQQQLTILQTERDGYLAQQEAGTLENIALLTESTENYNIQEQKVNGLNSAINRLGTESSLAYDVLIAKQRLYTAELEAASLSSVISRAQEEAGAGLKLASETFGVRFAGASEEFMALLNDFLARNPDMKVADVLADENTINTLRRSSLELKVLNTQAQGLNSVADAAANSFANAFSQIILGTMNGTEAFKMMAMSILQEINTMIVRMLILQSLMPFFKGGSGIQGTDLAMDPNSVSLMGPTTVINQGAFNPAPISVPGLAMGGIMKYASGGVMPANSIAGTVTSPTYLVGEGKYNEAVVPLPNGKHIPVQMHGSSGETNVVVNVNVSDTGTTSTQEGMDPAKLGQAISTAVQRELMAQKSPGGLLSKYG
jgi:hypothetical protein